MIRSKFLFLVIVFVLLLSACSQAPAVEAPVAEESVQQPVEENAAPVLPETEPVRINLEVYLDGQPLKEGGYACTEMKAAMADNELNETTYYSATIQNIVRMDLSSVKGAFLEAVDGYISYVEDVSGLYLAAYKVEDGEYQSVELEGSAVYAGVVSGAKDNKGVSKVYLVTTPADFAVEIQKNGEKIGSITIKEFMQKTEVGGQKVATGMFDGSFLTNFGADSYTGRFLGISYETMLAKLIGMGLDLSENPMEVEYYGTNGLKVEGKNTEYSTDPESDKYFGLVDFYCMYDGKTFNSDTAQLPVGLTAFINGTGGRWMTMNLTAINFIYE